jgi:hypothetical protein
VPKENTQTPEKQNESIRIQKFEKKYNAYFQLP